MKKILLLGIAFVYTCSAFAQLSSVTGVAETAASEICLFRIEDGKSILYARSPISPSGKFGFMFEVSEEGFFSVGFDAVKAMQVPVYLKPGDNATLEIVYSPKVHAVSFPKNNTPENRILGEWLNISETVRNKSLYTMGGPGALSTYEDFFPDLEVLLSDAKEFKKNIKTPNKRFDRMMRQLVDFNAEFYALHYFRMPRLKWPPEGYARPEFYTSMIRPERFTDDLVLGTLYGNDYLLMYIDNATNETSTEEEINIYMGTDRLKGLFYLPKIGRVKDYQAYLLAMERYGHYFKEDAQRKAAEEIGAKLYETRAGGQAADFTYPDIDGRKVSLSDFKGKVVVVDVWATWCGPCKTQIPHLKELEKNYAGRDDIVFLAVSVDEQKDYDTWKNMIRDEELPSIHLFANGWSKITKDYKIKGIPRFMIFDKKGNVVSADAPRPSQPELKIMIDKTLLE